jgi:hypothetical protein
MILFYFNIIKINLNEDVINTKIEYAIINLLL